MTNQARLDARPPRPGRIALPVRQLPAMLRNAGRAGHSRSGETGGLGRRAGLSSKWRAGPWYPLSCYHQGDSTLYGRSGRTTATSLYQIITSNNLSQIQP